MDALRQSYLDEGLDLNEDGRLAWIEFMESLDKEQGR